MTVMSLKALEVDQLVDDLHGVEVSDEGTMTCENNGEMENKREIKKSEAFGAAA